MYFFMAVNAFHSVLTAGLWASHERPGGENDSAIKTLPRLWTAERKMDIFLVIVFATVEVHSTH